MKNIGDWKRIENMDSDTNIILSIIISAVSFSIPIWIYLQHLIGREINIDGFWSVLLVVIGLVAITNAYNKLEKPVE